MTNEEIMYEIDRLNGIKNRLLDCKIGLSDEYEDIWDSLDEAYDSVCEAIEAYESRLD